MKEKQVALYGSWKSCISAEQLATNGKRFFDIVGDEDQIYNVEMRSNEQGRYVLVSYKPDGTCADVLPAPFSVRTRVHEYGGRAFTVHAGIVYFVNYIDQHLYKFKLGEMPTPLNTSGIRFAELNMTPLGLIAVAEQHNADGSEAKNFIAIINPDNGEIKTLIDGYDFYAFPTVNLNGTRIAWMCWNHPNMPWDDTDLYVADIMQNNVENIVRIDNGHDGQSFYQPQWDANNDLLFISDLTDWWNPYRWYADSGAITNIYPLNSEFAKPLMTLGVFTWGFYKNLLLYILNHGGMTKFALLDPTKPTGENTQLLDVPFDNIDRLCIHGDNIYFIGASATQPPVLVCYSPAVGIKILAESSSVQLPMDAISLPQKIDFPTTSRQGIAYAYFYPPINPEFKAPEGSKPPLMIVIHGGPTAAATNAFSLEKQYWTSRGFAIADVDYGGSTGYGRKYRKALQRDSDLEAGYWGEIDINDCVACVRYLVANDLVDPQKIVIRGGSAGGYTTLQALATSKIFAAGTSYFGVSDLTAFIKDTHKFESRYIDQLVGAYPQFSALYQQRSPLANLAGFSAPLLVLQGDDDEIVLPNQAEMMVKALQDHGLRVEYKLYQGEQHGFRKAETIIDSLTRELEFYLSVFYPRAKTKGVG